MLDLTDRFVLYLMGAALLFSVQPPGWFAWALYVVAGCIFIHRGERDR